VDEDHGAAARSWGRWVGVEVAIEMAIDVGGSGARLVGRSMLESCRFCLDERLPGVGDRDREVSLRKRNSLGPCLGGGKENSARDVETV
jgi:hypothetical protein